VVSYCSSSATMSTSEVTQRIWTSYVEIIFAKFLCSFKGEIHCQLMINWYVRFLIFIYLPVTVY
jgi:hypothetical protein